MIVRRFDPWLARWRSKPQGNSATRELDCGRKAEVHRQTVSLRAPIVDFHVLCVPMAVILSNDRHNDLLKLGMVHITLRLSCQLGD